MFPESTQMDRQDTRTRWAEPWRGVLVGEVLEDGGSEPWQSRRSPKGIGDSPCGCTPEAGNRWFTGTRGGSIGRNLVRGFHNTRLRRGLPMMSVHARRRMEEAIRTSLEG